MKTRYFRLARRYFRISIISSLIGIVAGSYAIASALDDEIGRFFLLLLISGVSLFSTIARYGEGCKCLRISRKWDAWDAREF